MLDQTTTVAALEAILRRPLLCAGEDPAQYDQLRKMMIDEIRPATAAEYLLANDIAEAEWELLRLHGFKAAMVNIHMLAVLKQSVRESGITRTLINAFDKILKLFRGTIAGDHKARTELEKLLDKMKLSLSDVAATAFETNIAAQIQTGALINAALRRREAAYAELAQRHDNRPMVLGEPAPPLIASPVRDKDALSG